MLRTDHLLHLKVMKNIKLLLQLLFQNNFAVLLLFSSILASCDDTNPDGLSNGNIAFSSDRGGKFRIYIMDAQGQDVRQVTDDAALQDTDEDNFNPSFSRDGKKIAFSTFPHINANAGIGKVNAAGTDKRLLGFGVPDLQYVNEIFGTTWTSYEDLYFIAGHPDGLYYYSGATKINRISAEWCFAMYGCVQYLSPAGCLADDSGVVFGLNGRMYLVKFDGEVSTVLEGSGLGYPSYSPDGKKIVSTNDQDIFVRNADGSNVVQITHHTGVDNNSQPVWSPDGKKIAFTGVRSNNYEIFVMNSDGTSVTNISNSPGDDTHPTWAKK